MQIRLFKDDTIDLRLDEIVANLNRLAPGFKFTLGQAPFSVHGRFVIAPSTYGKLNKRIDEETRDDDEVYLFTEKPYDNNFFWESDDKKVIVSLAGWDYLTSLSRNNGAVYFICALLIRDLDVGGSHDTNTGCINDFWWDKTGVDAGMRCAFVCEKCLRKFDKKASAKQKELLGHIRVVLDELSAASRANLDVCDYWSCRTRPDSFDVFMCHNSDEKDTVREMNVRLKNQGIKTWFDEEQLPPGRPWQDLLEQQIEQITTAAVFVGGAGIGPWQRAEIRGFLSEFVDRGCPVIPVILPDCRQIPKLPVFMRQMTWVDFRKTIPDPFKNLVWGITGKRP